MESIKKLRKSLPEHIPAVLKWRLEDVQAEIDERYMKLPMDADGVPIHIGDELEAPLMNDRFRVEYVGESWVIGTNGITHDSSNTRHVKSDPVKGLLKEFDNRVALNGYQ